MDLCYEDESLLILNKPAGRHSAPLGRSGQDSVLEEAVATWPYLARVRGRAANEAGLVHRLDRDTSGLLLIAKTQRAYDGLGQAQDAGQIRKGYLALCVKGNARLPGAKPPDLELGPEGTIEGRFRAYGPGRARVAPLSLAESGSGRVYLSRVLSLSPLDGAMAGVFSCQLALVRGFRHQLRAHLAWIGYPILGDQLYSDGSRQWPRLCLHAWRLELPHPETACPLRVECQVDFTKA